MYVNAMILCVWFQSDKETRAINRILLLGYDVVYLERDGKYSHALHISHPGCETHMFYADSKDSADLWLEVNRNPALLLVSLEAKGSIYKLKTVTS